MNFLPKLSIISVLFILPLTLHSTDIYISSGGAVKIHSNLNSHIIPGDPKLGNTVLIVSAPIKQGDIHIVTKCEHRESILYKKPTGNEKILYIIQLSFPTPCDVTDISLGDKENIFTDSIFSLPMESLSKMENGFINTDSIHLLPIMRERQIISEGTGTAIEEKLQHIQALYKNLSVSLESDMAQNILHDRENIKYISPVAGYVIPTKEKLIPGA